MENKLLKSIIHKKSIMESWKYNVRLFLKGDIIHTKLVVGLYFYFSAWTLRRSLVALSAAVLCFYRRL